MVFISPIPIKCLHKDPLTIYDLFCDIKIEIFILAKPKNQYLQIYRSIYTITKKYL